MMKQYKEILRKIKFVNPISIIETLLIFIVSAIAMICVYVVISTVKESYDLLIERRIALNEADTAVSFFEKQLGSIKNIEDDFLLISKDEIRFIDSSGVARILRCSDNRFLFDDKPILNGNVFRCRFTGYDKNQKETLNKKNIVRMNLFLSVDANGFGLFGIDKDVWLGKKDYYEKFAEN